jgi:CheY-like chemotaxis protein
MAAVDMIEEAGFEVLEATNADEAILLLEARRDITVVFTDVENAGFDGRPQARPGRQGRLPPIKIIATSGRYVVRDGDLPSRAVLAKTLQPRPDFQRLTGPHRPGLKKACGDAPASGKYRRKKIRRPLETGSAFSSFLACRDKRSGRGRMFDRVQSRAAGCRDRECRQL